MSNVLKYSEETARICVSVSRLSIYTLLYVVNEGRLCKQISFFVFDGSFSYFASCEI